MGSAQKRFDGISQLKSVLLKAFWCRCFIHMVYTNSILMLCRLRFQIQMLPGDMLLLACFVSYIGGFTPIYRHDLMENIWRPAFRELKVKHLLLPTCDERKSFRVMIVNFSLFYTYSPTFHIQTLLILYT